MNDRETTTPALGLPTPMSQSDDIYGGEIASALWRWRREWRRCKRFEARAEAEPAGPRKARLDDLIEHVACPAETAAEDALIKSIFKLVPPQPDRRYPDRGVSVVRIGGEMVVVTCDLDDDGFPAKGDTEVLIVPLDAAIRVRPARNVSFRDTPLRSPIRGPFPAQRQFALTHPDMGILTLVVWVGAADDWSPPIRNDRWTAQEYDGITIAIKGEARPASAATIAVAPQDRDELDPPADEPEPAAADPAE